MELNILSVKLKRNQVPHKIEPCSQYNRCYNDPYVQNKLQERTPRRLQGSFSSTSRTPSSPPFSSPSTTQVTVFGAATAGDESVLVRQSSRADHEGGVWRH